MKITVKEEAGMLVARSESGAAWAYVPVPAYKRDLRAATKDAEQLGRDACQAAYDRQQRTTGHLQTAA